MMRLSMQAGALNEASVNEPAGSFTLGAHRGTIHHGQQASGSLGSDASHLQTDAASSRTARGASPAVEAEPAVATAVDLADSDRSAEAALHKTSAHSSVSPGTAAVDDPQPLSSDFVSPTPATSSSGATPFQPHVSTAEAGSATQPSSDASSAGAAHDVSTAADKLAAREAVSSGDEGSQPMISSFPQGGEGPAPAESPSGSLLDVLVEGEKGAQLSPSSLPQGGEAHPSAEGRSAAAAAAEQVSAFAWKAAQLQSLTHATNAVAATSVSSTYRENTVQKPQSSEATDVQSLFSSRQQAACLEQQQDSSSVTREGGVESIANAQQSVEKQHTSSSVASGEEAQLATAAAAPVQPRQSLQQSAAEEEHVLDAATAREQQASSSTSKDEDDGDAAEEEQRPTDPSDGAEQSAHTSGPLLVLSSSPASEEDAAQQLQTSNAYDARLQASDISLRADSSSQRKAKPGFLAKALFCSVAWPVLVPIVAFSSCIQLYDACSMAEVLRYTV